jgi:hypothetical protein
VVSNQRPILLAGFAFCAMSLLTSCTSGLNGKSLERSLAADPNLSNNATVFGSASGSDRPTPPTVQLPPDFPSEIPRYPEAELQRVEPVTGSTTGQITHWSSPDPINVIQNFYQREFASKQWQIVSQPTDSNGGTIVARQKDLEVTLTIPASPQTAEANSGTQTNGNVTAFDIQYIRQSANATASPSPSSVVTQPATPSPSPATVANSSTLNSPTSVQDFTDLDKLPQELRQQIQDLAELGALSINPSNTKQATNATGTQFDPNKTITRREFARWLVAANNKIFINRPGQQIRLASGTSQPAFQDVPRTDPDFASIQALAEAGLIPSSLSGDTTAALFRPDAPLNRETLITWKVPLDTRQALPSASLDTIKQTWAFQDAAKIDPKAMRAIAADYQNGEQSNIRRMLGYTTLFQPKKTVSRAEAASTLWYFGSQGEGLSAREALLLKNQPSPSAPNTEATPSNNNNQ